MSQMTTSDRGSPDLPPPDPVDGDAHPSRGCCRNIARGARRRPCEWSSIAAGAARLEPRDEQVDQAFGVAQLGGGHPVELAVAQHLAERVGSGRDDDPFDIRSSSSASCRRLEGIGIPRSSGLALDALFDRLRLRLAGRGSRVQVVVGRRALERRGLEVALAPRALAPPTVEHRVVGGPVIATADEDRLRRRRGPVRVRRCRRAVSARAKSTAAPRSIGVRRSEGPPEQRRLLQEAPAIDLRPPRSLDDGGIVSAWHAGRRAPTGGPDSGRWCSGRDIVNCGLRAASCRPRSCSSALRRGTIGERRSRSRRRDRHVTLVGADAARPLVALVVTRRGRIPAAHERVAGRVGGPRSGASPSGRGSRRSPWAQLRSTAGPDRQEAAGRASPTSTKTRAVHAATEAATPAAVRW